MASVPQRDSNPFSILREFARFLRKLAAICALTAFVENWSLHDSRRTTQFECPKNLMRASGATEMAEIYQRQRNDVLLCSPDPLDQTSTSLLRIASAPLIWNLAYVAPKIHNFCCYIENHLATGFLSVLAERGDFRTSRQLQSGCTACRFGKCEYGPRCG